MSFSILVLDLHNTLYDEALEYGLAINEAIAVLLEVAKTNGHKLTRETIYKELASAHRKLGSDWDDEAWSHLPSLIEMGLEREEFSKAVELMVSRRREKSKALTLSTIYPGVRDTLSKLKMQGVRVYVITEAAADAAAWSINCLRLAGKVDGIYSYPSRVAPTPPAGTFLRHFPLAEDGGHVKKPHPVLIARAALDDAIGRCRVPPTVTMEEAFEISRDETYLIPEFPASYTVQKDVCLRLRLKDTPHAQTLERSLQSILYVGDSKFKDGLLARNAGVAFGYAAYGKKGQDSADARRSLAILYAVTGWDKEVIALTQEAGRAESVNRLKPAFTFEHALAEAIPLFA